MHDNTFHNQRWNIQIKCLQLPNISYKKFTYGENIFFLPSRYYFFTQKVLAFLKESCHLLKKCIKTPFTSLILCFINSLFIVYHVSTRRYMDVDSTFFQRYGRQNNVVCLLGGHSSN